VECGLRNAENVQRVKCGFILHEYTAFYTFAIFAIRILLVPGSVMLNNARNASMHFKARFRKRKCENWPYPTHDARSWPYQIHEPGPDPNPPMATALLVPHWRHRTVLYCRCGIRIFLYWPVKHWSSWHSGGNGSSAPIAGYCTKKLVLSPQNLGRSFAKALCPLITRRHNIRRLWSTYTNSYGIRC